jgi:outer membrane protein assembly factor BamB
LLAEQPERGLELLRKVKEQTSDPAWLKQQQVDELIASLEKYFTDARELSEHAQTLRAAGDLKSAHAELKELKVKFPLAPEALRVRLPVRIVSEPAGATFTVTTQDWAAASVAESVPAEPQVTPCVIDLPASSTFDIEVREAGYAPVRRHINPLEMPEVALHLLKAPALTVAAGIPCSFLQALDERLLVSSSDGRLQSFEPASGSRKWQAAFPEMEELIAGPVSMPGVIWMLSRRGTIASFEAATGSLTGSRSLGASAVCGPMAVANRLGILLQTKLLVMDGLGHELFTQTLKEVPRKLAATSDSFLLWSESGELSVLRASDGELQRSLTLPADTSCLVGLKSGGFAVGTSVGQVHVFTAEGEQRFVAAGEGNRSVTRLVDAGDVLLATCGSNSVIALGIEDGQRLGTYIDADSLRGLSAEPGHSVLVATRTARVIELSWPSLVQLDEYAAAGHLTGAGARVGDRTFFGSDDGQMYVFQTSR